MFKSSQKNQENFFLDSNDLVVDDDGSDSDSPLSPGPEGESEAHHRCIIIKIIIIISIILIMILIIIISIIIVITIIKIFIIQRKPIDESKMCRKRKSERGGKPRRARTAFTYEQLVNILKYLNIIFTYDW